MIDADLPDEVLMREYLEMNKAGFDKVFGANARRRGNEIADELLRRGITEIPNIFSTIKVRRWTW